MSLTDNVIGPINRKTWVRLRDLHESIHWMLNHAADFPSPYRYEFALNKEKEVYKKTLKKYLKAA